MFKFFATALGLAVCMAVPATAPAGFFKLYDPPANNALVNTGPPSDPNVLQLTSTTASGSYGGMEYNATGDSLTLNALTSLSALYEMTTGTFGAGAPRFTLFDNNLKSAYIYWGTPLGGGSFTDPHTGTFASTGNLADASSPDVRVYVNGFGGQNTPNTGETFGAFAAALGTTQISYITLDLDGGYSQPNGQQMITDEFTVNSNVYEAGPDPVAAPEPASFTLLCSGLTILAGYRLRRRRRESY